jgi:hypothetical protein
MTTQTSMAMSAGILARLPFNGSAERLNFAGRLPQLAGRWGRTEIGFRDLCNSYRLSDRHSALAGIHKGALPAYSSWRWPVPSVSHYLFFSIRVNCIEPSICRSLRESDSAVAPKNFRGDT